MIIANVIRLVRWLFGRHVQSAYMYTQRSERAMRTLWTIAFLYAMYNGSPASMSHGLWSLTKWLWDQYRVGAIQLFWFTVFIAIIFAVAVSIGSFMERRWRLAWTQASIRLLSGMTLVVTIGVGVVVAVTGHIFDWTAWDYWLAFQWTWQIPAGYFVGTGLSWSIKDRQLAGVVPVTPHQSEDGQPVLVEDVHHQPQDQTAPPPPHH